MQIPICEDWHIPRQRRTQGTRSNLSMSSRRSLSHSRWRHSCRLRACWSRKASTLQNPNNQVSLTPCITERQALETGCLTGGLCWGKVSGLQTIH